MYNSSAMRAKMSLKKSSRWLACRRSHFTLEGCRKLWWNGKANEAILRSESVPDLGWTSGLLRLKSIELLSQALHRLLQLQRRRQVLEESGEAARVPAKAVQRNELWS